MAMKNESPYAILTEGEFKAVAAVQWGFKAIGIPGISSYSDAHFKKLIDFITKAKIKQICIIFDSEKKDDPSLPNYKEEKNKRFDTEFYSYMMAKKIEAEGIDCRIGVLPESWRKNGKADLDGALADGHTVDEIKSIIANSSLHKQFFSDLSKDAKNVLQRKIAQKYFRSHISVNFGKYYATRYRGKNEWDEPISNFTIKIIATHETIEGVVREVILIDEYGNQSSSFALDSVPMSSSGEFKKFCLSKGNFIWQGNDTDMATIWQEQFFEDDGRHIIEPDHIGWIDEEKLFLFGNIAVREDGEDIRPDKSNIFWMKKQGIKPVPISVSTGRTKISEGIPYLNTSKIDIAEVREKLIDSLGKYEAMVALGWLSSVVFMEEVFGEYNCFPFCL
jgi:hypothetical protein